MTVQDPMSAADPGLPPEEQRLTRLEKNISLNRTLLVLVAAILTMAITVVTTILMFHRLYENPLTDYEQQLTELTQEVATLKQQNQLYQEQLEQIAQALPALEKRLDNSSAATFQKLLIEQEDSYQLFLTALKAGMHDLSHMVPGSRTWLEHYHEKLDGALKKSADRRKELQRLQTAEPEVSEDTSQ